MAVYKFTSFSTGAPLVSIEYRYDTEALTMTKRREDEDGNINERTRFITSEQRDRLDYLQANEQIEASYVFSEANDVRYEEVYDVEDENEDDQSKAP